MRAGRPTQKEILLSKERKSLIKSLRQSGKSILQLAFIFNLSKQRISKILQEK